MKKALLLLCFLPIIVFGQLSVGNNQTICLGDAAQIIATLSGPGTSGCNGSIDSLVSDIGPTNGQSGTMFNIINTSSSDVTITGLAQGTYTYSGAITMDIWYYPGDYVPVMSATNGWTQIATAVNTNLPVGATATTPLYTPVIPITSVTIPAGATYGFYMGGSTSVSYATAPAGTIPGVSPWGSNSILTITAGHGGVFPAPSFSPRGPLIKVYYGGGASWYDVNTSQMIGSGDTLSYSPTQTTNIAAVFDCNGQTYSDTMTLEVVNTAISSSGFSLCNGPLDLTAPNGFNSYYWNGPSTSQTLTVNNPGSYFVLCTTANNQTCQSPPITIYQDTIPVVLSTTDSVFVCQGDTVTIDGPLGFNQYNWNTGETTSSITTNITGNYSLTVADSNGCIGISNTTAINISPQTITATTTGYSLCNGSVTLNVSLGFASYQWFNNGLVYFGGTSPSLTITNPGTYHCEVVYPTGCTAISNSMAIVAGTGAFNVTISAVGEDSLCGPNGQVVLDAGNYASFIWSTGANTQQITVNGLGTYTVDVVDSSGCQGTSSTGFEVFNSVNTSPISGSTIPTQFQNEIYSVVSTNGSIYNWNANGATILSGTGTSMIELEYGPGSFGNYEIYVVETNNDGCVGDTISLSVIVFVSSIDEIKSFSSVLKKTVDITGRNATPKKNLPFFYLYEDGIVEKKIIIE